MLELLQLGACRLQLGLVQGCLLRGCILPARGLTLLLPQPLQCYLQLLDAALRQLLWSEPRCRLGGTIRQSLQLTWIRWLSSGALALQASAWALEATYEKHAAAV